MRDRIARLLKPKPPASPAGQVSPASGASPGGPGKPQPNTADGEPDTPLPPNRMLERLIAGRTVQAVAQDTAPASVTFSDGSVMKIKTGAPLPAATLTGKTIKAVRQGGLRLELDFADGSQAALTLAEETSSVLLRDARGNFEYAD